MKFDVGSNVWTLLVSLIGIWMVLSSTEAINDQQERGIVVENKFWKAVCFLHKPYEKHLSYVSIIFLVIGYVYLLLMIPLFIVAFCLPSRILFFITLGYAGAIWITFFIEGPFMPSWGMKGY